MNDDRFEKISDLSDRRNKNQILKDVYKEIGLTTKSKSQYIISIVASLIIGFYVSKSVDTVIIMRDIVEAANEILLVFVASIFGSYSIFQALMSEQLVALLISADGNILKESNRTFLNLTILYIIGIIENFVLITILKVIPDNFMIVNNIFACNLLAWIAIVLYLSFHLLLFLEVINFAINLYRMFCVYNTLKALETLDTEENNK